jgi:hypothetical protein
MVWLITLGKGVGITVPVYPVPAEKPGTWRVYNAQVSPEKANVSLQGERWGEPVKIVLNGKPQDPASATLIGKGEDLKDFGSITMLLKGSGKIKVNLYYTYNGKYSLLSKDVELSYEWKEVSFKLDEGLEFGLGMPSRPDVVMPYKVVISSEQDAEVSFGGAYIRR